MTLSFSAVLNLLNLAGVVAFAASGALVAMQKRFDIFGVLFLSCITAIWGGVLRDILLGLTPPMAFVRPAGLALALVTGLVVFLRAGRLARHGEMAIFYTDALGLGVFTAIGASRAFEVPEHNVFLVVMTGLLTGVGGGMLRDLLARETPFVLQRREVYATASIAGALLFYFAYPYLGDAAASGLCFAVTAGIRIFSKRKNIHLPKASLRK